jgi:hypothetical protein
MESVPKQIDMKVLFLDVDGVLNSRDSFVRNHQLWIDNGSKANDQVRCWPLGHLDVELIKRLNAICELTGCYIVLSSSWRTICELSDFSGWLKQKGFLFSDRFVGQTCHFALSGAENCRGMEIKDWLDKHIEVTSYVILDDDSFDIIKVHPSNFVHTDCNVGLQDEQVEKAVKILNI